MSLRRILAVALLAAVIGGAFVPTAASDHCRTKLTAYGRISTAPMAAPPYAATTSGVCTSLYGRGVDDHLLPPETDMVLVRVNGNFGGGIDVILVELNGLGFEGQVYPAKRLTSTFGGVFYQFESWVPLPDGPQAGELVVTAYYPAGPVTVVYHTLAAPEV